MTLIIWNGVTIWWNEVTLSWEEVTWNEVNVNRTDEHIFRFFQIAIQNSFPFILVDVSMHFLVLPSSEISGFFSHQISVCRFFNHLVLIYGFSLFLHEK